MTIKNVIRYWVFGPPKPAWLTDPTAPPKSRYEITGQVMNWPWFYGGNFNEYAGTLGDMAIDAHMDIERMSAWASTKKELHNFAERHRRDLLKHAREMSLPKNQRINLERAREEERQRQRRELERKKRREAKRKPPRLQLYDSNTGEYFSATNHENYGSNFSSGSNVSRKNAMMGNKVSRPRQQRQQGNR